MQTLDYVGGELDLFARAHNWKRYWSARIAPYVGPTVLDVGAGLGATIRAACGPGQRRWVALEPDAAMAAALRRDAALPGVVEARHGTIADVVERFDTVLYIDVLEHIEDDAGEMARAYERLRPGGHLVVLSPAHQFLFTPFDRAIGHFRRYSKRSLRACRPPGAAEVVLHYLDSVGIAASLANRLLLRQSMPTAAQIATWDRVMVPVSRVIDPLLGYAVGKSVLAVWRRPDERAA